MKAKILPILELAINEGVKYGYQRAHNHVDNPLPERICEQIEESVMESIHTYFDIDDTGPN